MEPRTLVLSPWMAPNRIATWQQAIVLVYTGKVDVLEDYDAVVSSPSMSLKIPAVVRLRKDINRNKSSIKFSRSNVYQRDGHRCCYDGRRHPVQELTYDHVLPRSRGGKTNWLGIVTSCRKCNTRKDNRTPAEAGMKMHFQPYVPTQMRMTSPLVFLVGKMPAAWRPYLADGYDYADGAA